jgi:hypothetical protein
MIKAMCETMSNGFNGLKVGAERNFEGRSKLPISGCGDECELVLDIRQ